MKDVRVSTSTIFCRSAIHFSNCSVKFRCHFSNVDIRCETHVAVAVRFITADSRTTHKTLTITADSRAANDVIARRAALSIGTGISGAIATTTFSAAAEEERGGELV